MPLALAIPLLALLVLAIACCVYFGVVLYRVLLAQRTLPAARDGIDLARELERREGFAWPALCVIVPAHNEQDAIATVAGTLLACDYPELRVVFALDRCTDGTDAALRRVVGDDRRVEIITVTHCPDDWAGKTHAMHRGYTDAAGPKNAELVLFADADTAFDPACLKACVALLLERELDLLSLLSTLDRQTWYERAVQPAAGLELVRWFPLEKINNPNSPRHFANGQFMLFRKFSYDAIGGHRRVKDELLEDIALAQKLQHKKRPYVGGCLMADGVFRCRMYSDWPRFRRGWKRIFTEASKREPGKLASAGRRLRLTGVVFPAAALLALAAGPIVLATRADPLGWWLAGAGALGVALFFIALSLVYRAQHAPAWETLLYPIGAWRVGSILLEAARDLRRGVATEWGGRTYARPIGPKHARRDRPADAASTTAAPTVATSDEREPAP